VTPTLVIARAAGALALCAALAGALAAAQPASTSPPSPSTQPAPAAQPAKPGPDDKPIARDALRARLQRRLDDSRRSQQRLEQALERLDSGTAPAEVLSDLDSFGHTGGRERSGAARDRSGAPDHQPGAGGHDGPPSSRGDHRRADAPAPAAQAPSRDQILAFLDEHAPRLAQRLRRSMSDNPPQADGLFQRFSPRIGEIIQLREQDPVEFTIRVDEFKGGIALFDAAGHLREAFRTGADSAAIEKESSAVRALVAQQFDYKIRRHQHEIDSLQERMTKLRTDLDAQLKDRDAAIDKQAQHIIDSARRQSKERPESSDKPSPRNGRD
jgi:hypothetical protein